MAVAYDEQDGDFVFTRGAKRVKTAAAEHENEGPEAAPSRPRKSTAGRTTKPPAKKRAPSPPAAEPTSQQIEPAQPRTTRRSLRRSSQQPSVPPEAQDDGDEPQLVVPKARAPPRRSTRASLDKEKKPKERAAEEPQPQPKRAVTPTPMQIDHPESPQNELPAGQKIALPFSDTPVINRNKDFRKKGGSSQRRSSLGMRGRRASSLIENGHSAIPHREVDAAEFYKHIEDGMLEPRRMRQLLTWCGERALTEKPPHGSRGSSAVLGGKSSAQSSNGTRKPGS
jgi:kinetochore protein Mis13/DSN1